MQVKQFIIMVMLGLSFVSASGQELLAQENPSIIQKKRDKMLGQKRDSTASALINGKLYEAIIIDGDTVPVISLPTARVTSRRVFKSKRESKKYYRLAYHVKKVLPYAKLAGKRMREVEEEVKDMTPKERSKRMKLLEKEIKRDYEGELTKLSFTQGRILIKLLDRETGEVSYDIVKEFRGGFTAWFFQGIAKMFDYDLKSEYDPEGDDKLIEEIVQKVERGEL
ncbi:MAG: DUF4294 domain-containing protein [Flavobacteriales bacterium]|nr:DUF4294 domain-containing protein [Flavobacteriales bacterium]